MLLPVYCFIHLVILTVAIDYIALSQLFYLNPYNIYTLKTIFLFYENKFNGMTKDFAKAVFLDPGLKDKEFLIGACFSPKSVRILMSSLKSLCKSLV